VGAIIAGAAVATLVAPILGGLSANRKLSRNGFRKIEGSSPDLKLALMGLRPGLWAAIATTGIFS
jgi:hypothetical protein